MSDSLQQALISAVTASKAPGAVAYIGTLDAILFHEAYGVRTRVPEARPAAKDTIYDLASLTKVIATTTAVMLLRDEGVLDLDAPASEYVPIPAFGAFTLRHLLTHTSGLTSGRPYYKECASLNEMLQRYAERGIDWPPGTRRRYSDVGFMILGKAVEMAARDSLDAFCAKRIFQPLGMTHTAFNPPKEWAETCAATEQCPWRKQMMMGAVHDENAYAVGGVSGHAGLFSTAEDIAAYCRALLGGKLLSEKTVVEMTTLGQTPVYPWQGLGWEIDPWSSGELGYLLSRSAFGHAGWTGASLWIDRAKGLFAILLSNTCHPTRAARNNGELRRTFYDAVAREYYPGVTTTHSGLDRLLRENFEPLREKRVALLTNQSAIDQMGRHILEVFALAPEVKLQRLYSPEHGIKGQAEAGAKVADQRGPVPVVSLYGERKQPSDEELAEIDLFVIDLQDVGARYYTYIATMKECLLVCVKNNTPVLILDRPNPVGGAILEGPIAVNTDAAVSCAPIPVRHGMTLGEVALFLSKEMTKGKNRSPVMVNTLDNWPRRYLFRQCSLPWVPPSPNIPTPETALLYAGMCLFEGTNLNEGRGTDTPFAVVGAPWLDARGVIRQIGPEEQTGCALEAVTYTPRSIPGKAENPACRDEECHGIRITITNAVEVRAFTLAVALLRAVHKRHPRRFEWKESFDVLAGSPELRARIEKGETALTITRSYAKALSAFNKARPRRYT